jgi:hypothetical protein
MGKLKRQLDKSIETRKRTIKEAAGAKAAFKNKQAASKGKQGKKLASQKTAADSLAATAPKIPYNGKQSVLGWCVFLS